MAPRRMFHAVLAILVVLLIEPAASPPTPTRRLWRFESESRIQFRLDCKLPEVKFDRVALSDVIGFIRDLTGMRVVVKWNELQAAGITRTDPVTARLFNVKTSKAIRVIIDSVSTPQAPLWYEIDAANEQVVITTYADYLARNTEVREYDIRDLMLRWKWDPNFCDTVSVLIIETVAPDSWVATGGTLGAFKTIGGRLFITQTRENHRQIEALMAQLRETANADRQHSAWSTPAGPGPTSTHL